MDATGAVTQMEHQDAAALMRRWFDEIWNRGRIESVDELLARGDVGHRAAGPVFTRWGRVQGILSPAAKRDSRCENQSRSSDPGRRHRIRPLDGHYDPHRRGVGSRPDEQNDRAKRDERVPHTRWQNCRRLECLGSGGCRPAADCRAGADPPFGSPGAAAGVGLSRDQGPGTCTRGQSPGNRG